MSSSLQKVIKPIQADYNQTNTTALDFIKNKPAAGAAQIQADYAQTNTAALDFVRNKPAVVPQVQSDFNQTNTAAADFIRNKPVITDSWAEPFSGAAGSLVVGDNFKTETTGGTYYINVPTGKTSVKIDKAFLYLTDGTSPTTATTVKMVRKPLASATLIDIASFVLPANSINTLTPIANTITTAIVLNQGDQIYMQVVNTNLTTGDYLTCGLNAMVSFISL